MYDWTFFQCLVLFSQCSLLKGLSCLRSVFNFIAVQFLKWHVICEPFYYNSKTPKTVKQPWYSAKSTLALVNLLCPTPSWVDLIHCRVSQLYRPTMINSTAPVRTILSPSIIIIYLQRWAFIVWPKVHSKERPCVIPTIECCWFFFSLVRPSS